MRKADLINRVNTLRSFAKYEKRQYVSRELFDIAAWIEREFVQYAQTDVGPDSSHNGDATMPLNTLQNNQL